LLDLFTTFLPGLATLNVSRRSRHWPRSVHYISTALSWIVDSTHHAGEEEGEEEDEEEDEAAPPSEPENWATRYD